MDFITFTLYIIAIFILATLIQRVYDKYQERPPGPIGLPLVGRFPFIIYNTIFKHHGNFFDSLCSDGASYGDMRFLRAGTRHFLILSSFDVINDALTRPEFSQRPNNDYYNIHRKVELNRNGIKKVVDGGLIASNSTIWQVHRRFALRVLRDFGMGKNAIESKVHLEAHSLTDELMKSSEKPINPNMHITKGVANVICQLVFGFRLGYEDPDFERQVTIIKEYPQNAGIGLFLPVFYPFIENKTFFRMVNIERFLNIDKQMMDYMASKIDYVESQYNTDDIPSNYIESYLAECKEQKGVDSSTFSRRQLIIAVADLFLAGMDTTSNVLNWALINMALYPEWQQKVQDELDRELGSRLDVSFVDRLRCPITQAFLDESMRFCSVVPHNVERANHEEVKFRGKFISPNTYIIADIKAAHNDPKLWTNPKQFLPTRFLSQDGQYRPSKHLIGFSIGKRVCLGESLARVEIFVFFASMMLRFKVEMDEETRNKGSDIYHGTDGFVCAPKDHKLIFRPRCIE